VAGFLLMGMTAFGHRPVTLTRESGGRGKTAARRGRTLARMLFFRAVVNQVLGRCGNKYAENPYDECPLFMGIGIFSLLGEAMGMLARLQEWSSIFTNTVGQVV
jgi:hypothetical protein